MSLVGHIEYVVCITLQSIKMYQELIKETIDRICEKHNLGQPIVVPAAGRMIAEYEGVDRAIELFEGATDEFKNDVFRLSAYKATLKTILYPMKENK